MIPNRTSVYLTSCIICRTSLGNGGSSQQPSTSSQNLEPWQMSSALSVKGGLAPASSSQPQPHSPLKHLPPNAHPRSTKTLSSSSLPITQQHQQQQQQPQQPTPRPLMRSSSSSSGSLNGRPPMQPTLANHLMRSGSVTGSVTGSTLLRQGLDPVPGSTLGRHGMDPAAGVPPRQTDARSSGSTVDSKRAAAMAAAMSQLGITDLPFRPASSVKSLSHSQVPSYGSALESTSGGDDSPSKQSSHGSFRRRAERASLEGDKMQWQPPGDLLMTQYVQASSHFLNFGYLKPTINPTVSPRHCLFSSVLQGDMKHRYL